jgi:tetratricopeptide (TPR) repeat protein
MTTNLPKIFRTPSAVLLSCALWTVLTCGCGRHSSVAVPTTPEASVTAAATSLQEGRYDEALSLLQPALKAAPNDPGVLNVKGAILTKKKDYQGAEAAYRAALAVSPEFFPARYNIGELMTLQGNWKEAMSYYRKLLSEMPGSWLLQYKVLLLVLVHGDNDGIQGRLLASSVPTATPAWYYAAAARSYVAGDPSTAKHYIEVAKSLFGDQTAVFQEELDQSGLAKRRK